MKLLILICLFVGTAEAKRLAPPEIKPVLKGKSQYFTKVDSKCDSEVEKCGMQVFLVSKHVLSGNVNWESQLYQVVYDPILETDVQDVHPVSLKLKRNSLIVSDERGSKYVVDSKTGKLIEPKIDYLSG